jgi:hypothetical protein
MPCSSHPTACTRCRVWCRPWSFQPRLCLTCHRDGSLEVVSSGRCGSIVHARLHVSLLQGGAAAGGQQDGRSFPVPRPAPRLVRPGQPPCCPSSWDVQPLAVPHCPRLNTTLQPAATLPPPAACWQGRVAQGGCLIVLLQGGARRRAAAARCAAAGRAAGRRRLLPRKVAMTSAVMLGSFGEDFFSMPCGVALQRHAAASASAVWHPQTPNPHRYFVVGTTSLSFCRRCAATRC